MAAIPMAMLRQSVGGRSLPQGGSGESMLMSGGQQYDPVTGMDFQSKNRQTIAQGRQDMQQHEQWAHEAEVQRTANAQAAMHQQSGDARNESRWNQMMGMVNSPSTGGSSASVGAITAPAAPPVAPPSTAPATAAANDANAASFGQAKATAGALGRSSMEGLRSGLAERGILGGGTEARGLTTRLAEATNPLSDLNTQQLHENAATTQHNYDTAVDVDKTRYQGDITQRGQNISAANAAADRQAAAASQQRSSIMSALQGLMRSY